MKPAEIDSFTGYRYYNESQLTIIGRISSLKELGFSLADIIRIIENYDDCDRIDSFMSARMKHRIRKSS